MPLSFRVGAAATGIARVQACQIDSPGGLADLGAAALHEDSENDDKQNAGDDANQCGAVHDECPF